MTAIDWTIVAFTLALAIWGYRQGLIVGALTLLGFAGGAFLGSRLGPLPLAEGAESPYAPLAGAVGALLLGGVAAVSLERLALNLRERLLGRRGFLLHADGAGGAALIASLALGVAWVGGALVLHAPSTGQLREDVRASLILRNLERVLPPSDTVVRVIEGVQRVPAGAGPPTPSLPPDPGIASDPDVVEAGRGVVRVLGTACGVGVEGSGWALRPGIVVTNAHVVAGSDDTTVTTQGGEEMDATAVHYDPGEDIALLRVEGRLPTLAVAQRPRPGSAAAVLGYPHNGPYLATPARLGGTRTVISEDSYGLGSIERDVSALRGEVRSGNSGGPIVDAEGRVLGTVFAATTSGYRGGFAIPGEAAVEALGQTLGEVDTGPCAS